jgi:hypothetical protein
MGQIFSSRFLANGDMLFPFPTWVMLPIFVLEHDFCPVISSIKLKACHWLSLVKLKYLAKVNQNGNKRKDNLAKIAFVYVFKFPFYTIVCLLTLSYSLGKKTYAIKRNSIISIISGWFC